MQVIVSGVQPTGTLHLGNYLGSISNWNNFQTSHKCLFPIVDLHAITAEIPDPKIFRQNIYTTLATYIACGINPKDSIIFQQSSVAAHSELFWILSCFTQMGKLNRMTQFKDKSGKNKEKAPLALYAYPVLMAADILLYGATKVSVGEDQLQHLELANEIVGSFNHKYGEEFFSKIEPLIASDTKRIMSLRDGTKKMSKSDESDMSRINLIDDADLIRKKIMKAKTDDILNLENLDERPEMRNLLGIFSNLSGKDISSLQNEYNSLGNKKLKEDLAEILVEKISPISETIYNLLLDLNFLNSVLIEGADKANNIANKNLDQIKKLMGFALYETK